MNTLTSLCIAILLILLFGACNKEPVAPTKLVVVLYDISGSTAQQPVRLAYVENSQAIFSNIDHGTRLYAGVISDRSLAQLKFLLSHDFPPYKPKTDNPLYESAERRKADTKLRATADSLLEVLRLAVLHTAGTPRTEIMDALHVAARIFQSTEYQVKILVLMSDMIEDSHRYNFERENLTPQRITQILSTEKDAKRIPDLKDVRTYVVGATAPSQRFFQIREFWQQYLATCGATVVTYGGPLIRFDE